MPTTRWFQALASGVLVAWITAWLSFASAVYTAHDQKYAAAYEGASESNRVQLYFEHVGSELGLGVLTVLVIAVPSTAVVTILAIFWYDARRGCNGISRGN